MLRGKVMGIAIGGFAGYIILCKLINSTERAVSKICDAAKWRAYYKHGAENTIPPGYCRTSRTLGNDDTPDDVVPSDMNKRNETKNIAKKIVNDIFETIGTIKNGEKKEPAEEVPVCNEDDMCDIPVINKTEGE